MKIRWDSVNESPLTVGLPIGVGIVPKDVFRPDGRGQAPHLRLVCLIFQIDYIDGGAVPGNTHCKWRQVSVCEERVVKVCVGRCEYKRVSSERTYAYIY